MNPISNPGSWYMSELYRQAPNKFAMIDRNFEIVQANGYFEKSFGGDWKGRKCYEFYKGLDSRCEGCNTARVFEDGQICVTHEYLTGKDGRARPHLVHVIPLVMESGEVPFVVELAVDITNIIQESQEYTLLFNKVPAYVCVVNRDYKVEQSNDKFRATFGEGEGRFCYNVFKQQDSPCNNCPTKKAFEDGLEHTATMRGVDKSGNYVHYYVTATPLHGAGDGVESVMEIATDITAVKNLQEQLERAFERQQTAIESSIDGMIVTDADGKLRLFNRAAGEITGYTADELNDVECLKKVLPEHFVECVWKRRETCRVNDAIITSKSGEAIPVQLSGSITGPQEGPLGGAAFIHDLRQIKQLEKEKLTAERLAAVGQTVAGLAHGVKNIITGLEGGMYVMNTGMTKGKVDLVKKGLSMLESNIDRISHFVKEFLDFARGKEPEVAMCDPAAPAREVFELYKDAAAKEGVELTADITEIAEAPMDSEGMHTCLANLVSNAIDACLMTGRENGRVGMRAFEKNDTIVYEVSDNGSGMDYEVKKKIFTSFFSTKGTQQGTGIGLLVTRKIIHEHGGSIDFETSEGEGTAFKIELPRGRLPRPSMEKESE